MFETEESSCKQFNCEELQSNSVHMIESKRNGFSKIFSSGTDVSNSQIVSSFSSEITHDCRMKKVPCK